MNEGKPMKNKIQGKWHEAKGAATGNTGEEMKGKLQGAKGDMQHKLNQAERQGKSMRADTRDTTRRQTNRTLS